MTRQQHAYAYALSAVLIWSTVASAFKLTLQHLSPAGMLLWANLVSVLLLGTLLTVRGELAAALSVPHKNWRHSLLLGALNPFLYYLVLFKAFTLLPAQEAQPLNYTWAITLSILAVFLLGQRLTRQDMLAIVVSYSGVLTISTRGDLLNLTFSDPAGVGLALGSTVVWALYWIYNTRDRRPPLQGLFLNFLCSLPLALLYSLFMDGFVVPPLPGLLGSLYIGCFEMGISFFLWLQALKYTASTAKISNLIFISPFLSLVFIHLLVGEQIYSSTYIGLLLIVGGLLIQQLRLKALPAGK